MVTMVNLPPDDRDAKRRTRCKCVTELLWQQFVPFLVALCTR